MTQQIRTPSGASVWSREQFPFIQDIEPSSRTIVIWRDTPWFFKYKDESTNEVIGYQLAEFLNLPVQPWLAVEVGEIEETGLEKPNIGILVQKWMDRPPLLPLEYLVLTQPILAGSALLLTSLISGDPEWMTDATMSDFRLIDLEYCGPLINFSEQLLIDGYLNCVDGSVSRNYISAANASSAFCTALTKLSEADLMQVIDFSGHSRAVDLANAAGSFLKPAQEILSRFHASFRS